MAYLLFNDESEENVPIFKLLAKAIQSLHLRLNLKFGIYIVIIKPFLKLTWSEEIGTKNYNSWVRAQIFDITLIIDPYIQNFRFLYDSPKISTEFS